MNVDLAFSLLKLARDSIVSARFSRVERVIGNESRYGARYIDARSLSCVTASSRPVVRACLSGRYHVTSTDRKCDRPAVRDASRKKT